MKSLLTFVFIILHWCIFSQGAERGIIDVRATFTKGSSIKLDGEWEFFWNEVKTIFPQDESIEYFGIPGLWNNQASTQGQEYPSFGCATFKLKVLLDPTIKYAIHTPAVYNSFNFYINGELVSKNGKVGLNQKDSDPFWHPETHKIEPSILKDTNEFVLQIANFDHFKGGTVDSIILGKRDELLHSRYLLEVFDTFLTGALIMGGLFFLGLYFFGRQQQSVLYFSLLSLVISYYIAGSGNYVLHGILPSYPWNIAIRVEFITIYLISILVAKFTQALYPDETPRKLVKVMAIIAAIYVSFVLFLPATIFPRLHDYFLIVLFLIIFFGLYVYIKAYMNRRVGSIYSLIGAFFLLSVFMLRLLNQLYPFDLPVFVVPLGYMAFFFLHALTLSQQFAIAWKQAKNNAEQALEAKSNFLSTMSHEIRTPMNAVIGLTNHLIEDNPKKEHMEVLETLKFSSKNLLVLINDVLDYSKIESNKVTFAKEPVELKGLIENLEKVFRPISDQKEIALKFEFDESIPPVIKCDPTRTSQVLTNLIGNAIKFTDEGSVTLSVRLLRKAKGRCNILFEVIDTGIGIASDKLNTIFESFTQASESTTKKYGGTGLGLAISRKILELQGVELKVESEYGTGSRFFFEQLFKIAEKSSLHDEKKRRPTEMSLDASVLLVEDNEVNVLVAMKFLSKWGLSVDVAKNGQEALDQLQGQSYDVVLMDVQMPVMNGYVASKMIRKSNNNVPIIALTASALPEERELMFEAGMNDYVLKPFEPSELFEKISLYAKRYQ